MKVATPPWSVSHGNEVALRRVKATIAFREICSVVFIMWALINNRDNLGNPDFCFWYNPQTLQCFHYIFCTIIAAAHLDFIFPGVLWIFLCTAWVSNLQPMATIVNYVCTIRITQQFRQLYHLLLFFHEQPMNQPTVMGVVNCHKGLETHGLEFLGFLWHSVTFFGFFHNNESQVCSRLTDIHALFAHSFVPFAR